MAHRTCELCGDDLEQFGGIMHEPPTLARCSFCLQPHELIDGRWRARDRWTGELL